MNKIPDAIKSEKAMFPQFLVKAGIRLQECGLAYIQPPADLVEKTVMACEHSLHKLEPPFDKQNDEDPLAEWILTNLVVDSLPKKMNAFVRAAASNIIRDGMALALGHKGTPPAYTIENHYIREPEKLSEYKIIKILTSIIEPSNQKLLNRRCSPVRRLVILRPRVEDYDNQELKAIRKALEIGNSDTYWLPYQSVVNLPGTIAIVARNQVFNVLRASTNEFQIYDKPADCLSAAKICEKLYQQTQTGRGLCIRVDGKLTTEPIKALEATGTAGIRDLLTSICTGNSATLRLHR